MSTEPEYDVAISFLATDEPVAKALATALEGSGLRVFFFPHNQEELAGTNGMESMRAPFLDARANVVLFHTPWGETPWTRVESSAITERCLSSGWTSLMFVELDKDRPLPKWLPTTHVRFSFKEYGIDQLVGAIKLRVQEAGGRFSAPTAMSEAKRIREEANYLAEREHLTSDRTWIVNTVHRAIVESMQALKTLADDANAQHGYAIEVGARDKSCVMRSSYVSLGVGWQQPIFNRVRDDHGEKCYLRAAEFSGALLLPGENGWVMHKPTLLKEHRFKVEVTQERKLAWIETGHRELIYPEKLPDHIFRYFLQLISRANQGTVQPPSL